MRRIGPVCALLFVVVVVPSPVLGQKPPAEMAANSVERGFADVSGGRLYYEIAGSGDPVVLIHGGWGDIRYWDEQFEALSRKYRVLRYDVRGYGKSSLPVRGVPYTDHEDLAHLLDRLRVRNERLVGFSMGSRIAVDYVLEFPTRSRSLTVVGPVVSAYSSPLVEAFTGQYPKIREVLKAGGRKAASDYLVDVIFAGTTGDASTIARIRAIVNDHSFWSYENESPRRPLRANDRLSEIRIPTLALTAERDVPFCQETADRIVGVVQGAEKAVLPIAGHFMMLERSEGFNQVLLDFFRRH